MKYVQKMRCNCRRMAHMMENRDRMEGGTSQLPRTRTSRVPIGNALKRDILTRGITTAYHPELHRSSVLGRNGL